MVIPLKRLCGKIAIVTAATDGIGLSIAQRLAQEGAKVIISSRKEHNVKAATKKLLDQGLDVTGLVCHVSNKEHRKQLFATAEKAGRLDILVSNAAVNPCPGKFVLESTDSEWDKIFDVNVKSSYLLAKEGEPLLKKSQSGRLIFISSIAAYKPYDFLGAYGISKTALLALTKAAALQLGPDNITVNCVVPGPIYTRFSGWVTSREERLQQTISDIPLGRLGEPKEVAGVVAMLASDDGSYITGENIVVAGGMASRL